jgi:hypothetical protein
VTEAGRVDSIRWRNLPVNVRGALEGKLKGLYGVERDEEAFDNLAVDKQQALLLLTHRLGELHLWSSVRRVANVYGTGGVGMNFRAWPELLATLRRRKEFTARFARHRDNAGGFLERGRGLGSLHFLYQEGAERMWAVHFDLYNPWASPASAWRHLLHEKLLGEAPDWRAVRRALSLGGKLF